MNPAGLAKGALFGALLGAAFTGFRTYGSRKTDHQPLPVECENLETLDAELITSLQELREMVLLPAQTAAIFVQNFTAALNLLERVAAIEVQIENQEIVPTFREANEAADLAERAMIHLRRTEEHFESFDLRQQYRQKVTDIQAQIGQHLNNINSSCLHY